MTITDEQLEELGRLADQANNLAAASQLPLPAAQHVVHLRNGLLSIDQALRKLYVEISGDDPWEGQ
jgi:hypothetical protein